MWNRAFLKERAKFSLKGKYWTAFGVYILSMVVSAASSILMSVINNAVFSRQAVGAVVNGQSFMADLWKSMIVTMPVQMIYSYAIGIVVTVGLYRWYSRNREALATPPVETIFSLFKAGSYLKTIGSMLWMTLLLLPWYLPPIAVYFYGFITYMDKILNYESLFGLAGDESIILQRFMQIFSDYLLFSLIALILSIPLIIMAIRYSMVPWILADNPGIGYRRAIKLSVDLTRGQVGKIFVLYLSFIGWFILGTLACGIGIIFVYPYYFATMAELYAALRQQGVENGACTMEELGFVRATANN